MRQALAGAAPTSPRTLIDGRPDDPGRTIARRAMLLRHPGRAGGQRRGRDRRVRARRVGAPAPRAREPRHGPDRQPRGGGRLPAVRRRRRDDLGPRAVELDAPLAGGGPRADGGRAARHAPRAAAAAARRGPAVARRRARVLRAQRQLVVPAGGDHQRDHAARRRHDQRDELPAGRADHALRLRAGARARDAGQARAARRHAAGAAGVGARERGAAGRAVRGGDRRARRTGRGRAAAGGDRVGARRGGRRSSG